MILTPVDSEVTTGYSLKFSQLLALSFISITSEAWVSKGGLLPTGIPFTIRNLDAEKDKIYGKE